MTEKKKRLSPFAKGMLIYVAVFAVLAAIALGLFHLYIRVYEASRPATAIKAYVARLETEGPTAACLAALEGVDEALCGPEEQRAWAEELLERSSFAEAAALSDAEHRVYAFKADGNRVGLVTLEQTGGAAFGFRNWAVTGEDWDFSAYLGRTAVTVPADYTVLVNGVALDGGYITDAAVPYETLRECYERFDGLPYLVRYESGAVLGEAALTVLDASGAALDGVELDEYRFLDNCSDPEKGQIGAFLQDFLNRYVVFSSDLNGASWYNYGQLSELVVREGQLHNRMRQAFEGFGYSNTYAIQILEIVPHVYTDLGNGYYLADVSYTTETVGLHGAVEETLNVRVLLQESDGTLLAEALYNY